MLVKDIMTPKEELKLISQMDTVRDALILMRKHNVKSLIVKKSSKSGAYGIVTYKIYFKALSLKREI